MGKKNIWAIGGGKGGVGKSTLSIMLARALSTKMPAEKITVIDTDLQRTTTEFLSASNPEINIEFLPITPTFSAVFPFKFILFLFILHNFEIDKIIFFLIFFNLGV